MADCGYCEIMMPHFSNLSRIARKIRKIYASLHFQGLSKRDPVLRSRKCQNMNLRQMTNSCMLVLVAVGEHWLRTNMPHWLMFGLSISNHVISLLGNLYIIVYLLS